MIIKISLFVNKCIGKLFVYLVKKNEMATYFTMSLAHVPVSSVRNDSIACTKGSKSMPFPIQHITNIGAECRKK